ncbi:MAG: hypothetical protein A2W19_11310 [Spirochaetes bacterium RBG_16_49_21]|nr:MAG: hypothetical protein A2W19_11310 [Spirochaetes bacterium RBG_16_49_21]
MFKKGHVYAIVMIIFIAAMSSGSWSADKYKWKLEGTSDGIQTYTSEVPGKEYIAAKCIGVIPAGMDVIGVVLRDIANYPQWMYDCSATKVLKVVNDQADTFIFWFHQHVPLLTDRDMILKSYVVNNYPKGWSDIRASSSNEMNYEGKKGLVRMPSFYSQFLMEWVDKDHTRVTFMIDPDLGKGLPTGMSNSTIRKSPYKSLQGLAKMVKLQKYIDEAKTSKYKKMIDDALKKNYIK